MQTNHLEYVGRLCQRLEPVTPYLNLPTYSASCVSCSPRPLEPLGVLAGDALGDPAGGALPRGSSSSPSRCLMLRATRRSSSDARDRTPQYYHR